ncbi:hypothetical protein RCL1_008413 [Eukaryota sp. TZLM3-RCL]
MLTHSIRRNTLKRSCYSTSSKIISRPKVLKQSTALSRLDSKTLALASQTPKWHPPWELYKVIRGHRGTVNAVVVDPSNDFFCSAASDTTVKLWDLASGALRHTLTGHSCSVRALAIDSRWPYLFSSGDDKQIFLQDLSIANNAKVRSFFGHSSSVNHLAIHPTLNILFSGSGDNTIKAWDIRSPKPITTFVGHQQDIAGLVCREDSPTLISSSFDLNIKFWDLKMMTCIKTLTNHSKPPRGLALHPMGNSFCSGDSEVVKVWDLPRGSLQGNYRNHVGSTITKLIVNHDDVIVGSTRKGELFFWDYQTGHNYQKIDVDFPGCDTSQKSISDIQFDYSQTRILAACDDGSIKMFKVVEDAQEQEISWIKPKEISFF